MKQINSFFEIDTFNADDTMIILDIDETILYYDQITPNWWADTFKRFYTQTNDYDAADTLTTTLWSETIQNMKPRHTDENGLRHLLNNYNCVFVTARMNDLEQYTMNEFEHLNIPYRQVHYCGSTNKGDVILSLLPSNVKNVIFIDDRKCNCIDVKEALLNNDFSVHIYQFVLKSD